MTTKIHLFIWLFLFSNLLNAQYSFSPYQTKQFKSFFETKTLVVLTGNKEYDENIKLGMEAYWEHTEFEFIDGAQFDEKILDSKYSFIVPMKYSMEATSEVRYEVTPIIGAINGGKKLSKLRTEHIIGMALTDRIYSESRKFGREKKIEDYAYRVKHMISYINDAILEVKQNEMSTPIPKSLVLKLLKVYQSKSKIIKNKTLLIQKEVFDEDIEKAAFREYFNSKYKIVSKEEIAKAMRENDKRYCVLLTFKTPGIHYFIASTEDATIYFGDGIPATLKIKKIGKKSLKKLQKAMAN